MALEVPYIQIEPTTKCNFTCGFCVGRKMEQGEMALETFSKVMDNVTGVRHIQLQGEGEPFSHPDLFAMIKMLEEKHPTAKISITTNGTFLTEMNIQKILNSNNIHSILVSIESPSPDRFRQIRGGNLLKIIENLKKFMALKMKGGFTKPALGFAVTILNTTFTEFKDIVHLYEDIGMDGEFTIQFLQQMKTYTAVYSDEMKKEIPSLIKIREFQKNIEEDQQLDAFLREKKVVGFFDELYAEECTAACTWLKQGLFVNHEGYVTGCSYIKNKDFSFGNIEQISMKEILDTRNETLEQLTMNNTPKSCMNCPDLAI